MCGLLHAQTTLPPRKEPAVPTELEAGWALQAMLNVLENTEYSYSEGNSTITPQQSRT
jgi:hypothetical protein